MRIRDPEWKEFGSGINIPDPQHCCYVTKWEWKVYEKSWRASESYPTRNRIRTRNRKSDPHEQFVDSRYTGSTRFFAVPS